MSEFLYQTDSYKVGHAQQYPEDMTGAYAYFESRGGKYAETIFFGLQYYLYDYLSGRTVDDDEIQFAEKFWSDHFGRQDYFQAERWYRLCEKHDGMLPLLIKAVPEGMLVPTGNVLFTVENTDPEFAWLVGYVETLLMKVWYPTTIETQSFDIKRRLASLRDAYSDSRDGLDFMVHDFGYRGATSEESAGIAGAAHLLSFLGTDTTAGIRMLQRYYTDPWGNPMKMYGHSVPATEHSIILAFSEQSEQEAYEHYLKRFPEGIVACVSDTYDLDRAVRDMWLGSLKTEVMNRQGVLVIRPDSGDPRQVVLRVLDEIHLHAGATRNEQGLAVLDPHYRVIQGDGMNAESIPELYEHIVRHGYAPENLTIGAGGGMIQGVNRDTQRFAFKVSSVTRNGQQYAVRKHPATDHGKDSKAGRVTLQYTVENGVEQFSTTVEPVGRYPFNGLQQVFKDGYVSNHQTVEDIRERIERRI
jgi:nicotinamide phosphoribosyltransferase